MLVIYTFLSSTTFASSLTPDSDFDTYASLDSRVCMSVCLYVFDIDCVALRLNNNLLNRHTIHLWKVLLFILPTETLFACVLRVCVRKANELKLAMWRIQARFIEVSFFIGNFLLNIVRETVRGHHACVQNVIIIKDIHFAIITTMR